MGCSASNKPMNALGWLEANSNFTCYNDPDPESRFYSAELQNSKGVTIEESDDVEVEVYSEESFQTGYCNLKVTFSGFPIKDFPLQVTFYREGQALKTEIYRKNQVVRLPN